VQLPVFLVGLTAYITFALLMAFFRATYIDFWGVILCVAMMSISSLFYIIGGQYVVSKIWNLVPISGYSGGLDAFKFLVLPVVIGALAGVGSGARWYRTIFLEEMGKDYVRTARAKGVPRRIALWRHALPNALVPILTIMGLQFANLIAGAIVVGKTTNYWCENKLFIFDDTLLHQSFNESDKARYCLFVDIVRPSLVPALLAGLPLEADDEHDPDVFRLDLSALGMPAVRVVFAQGPGPASAVYVDLPGQPLSLERRSPLAQGHLVATASLGAIAGTSAAALMVRRRRGRDAAKQRRQSP